MRNGTFIWHPFSVLVGTCFLLVAKIVKKGLWGEVWAQGRTKTDFGIPSDPLGRAGACTPAQFSLCHPRPSRLHFWNHFGIKLRAEISTILFLGPSGAMLGVKSGGPLLGSPGGPHVEGWGHHRNSGAAVPSRTLPRTSRGQKEGRNPIHGKLQGKAS